MRKKIIVLAVLLLVLVLGSVVGFIVSKYNNKGLSLGYWATAYKYKEERNYIQAIAFFNRAIALSPDSILAHISLADCYRLSEYYDAGLQEYEAALKLSETEGMNPKERKYIEHQIEQVKRLLQKPVGNK